MDKKELLEIIDKEIDSIECDKDLVRDGDDYSQGYDDGLIAGFLFIREFIIENKKEGK